jgi:hypothetical protein
VRDRVLPCWFDWTIEGISEKLLLRAGRKWMFVEYVHGMVQKPEVEAGKP